MDGLEKQSQLRKVKAIVFDFDGTLAVLNIDFSLMREKVSDIIRRCGVKEDSIKERYLLEIIDEVYQFLWKKNPDEAQEFYQESHGVLHEIEMEAAQKGRLIAGVEDALKVLRQKGMKLGIITRNGEKPVRKVFPEIDDYCDVFISRDFAAKVKPHPDHLNSVLGALKVSGEEAIMVGDHLIDVQAGKQAGMMTIGVLTGRIKRKEFEEAKADYILRDVSEIYPLLKEGI